MTADVRSPSSAHAALIRSAPLKLTFAGGDVPAWQRKLRRKLRELLVVPANTHEPLRPTTLWRRTNKLGTIEKVTFRASANAEIPAYWCVPAGQKPLATFICLQGHSTGMHLSVGLDQETETRPINPPGDRDFALGCLRRGIAALCIEQRCFGERRETRIRRPCPRNGCHDAVTRLQLLGRTLLGERVFDVERAIDYLAARGDVDMYRVGVMGHSSGGTTSMYAAALLPQIAWCMPSGSTGTYAGTFASIYHCGCSIIPGVLQWMEMGDVLGAIAPRPLVLVSGRNDEIMPIDQARKTYRHARAIYSAAGAAGKIRFAQGPGGHDYYAKQGWSQMLKLL